MSETKHNAFGLTIASCLPCPALSSADGAADVTIRYGDVPEDLGDARHAGVRYQASPGQLLLRVDGVARFLVRNGREIIIDRDPGTSDDDVRLFLLGSAFGALLQQRGHLTLQASLVQVEDECVLFLGKSDTGKSTLAAALQQRGYQCLGDDLCDLVVEDGAPRAFPAYPEITLWPDSLRRLGINMEGLRRVRPALDKRAWPLAGPFGQDCRSVKQLFLLWPSRDAASISMHTVAGSRKAGLLLEHTYRLAYLQGLGLRVPHFRQIEALCSRLTLTRIVRPRDGFLLDELADRVLVAFQT